MSWRDPPTQTDWVLGTAITTFALVLIILFAPRLP